MRQIRTPHLLALLGLCHWLLLGLLLGLAVTAQAATTEYVTIQAGTPAKDLPSLKDLRAVAFGGTTLCGLNPIRYSSLDPLPFESIRMLQFEHALRVDPVTPAKGLQIPKNLDDMFRLCETRKLTPHVIIGNRPPKDFLYQGSDGWTYGPKDWAAYKHFMAEWMAKIFTEYNFHDVIFEVGNEFDLPDNNWLMPAKLNIGDQRLYDGYLRLYSELSEVILDLRERFPDRHILFGGPNIGFYSFLYQKKEMNWASRFVADTIAKDLPLDFVSMHIYADTGSGEDQTQFIGSIRQEIAKSGRNIPMWLTEWGTCSVPWQYGTFTENERAGTYIFMSADAFASLGVRRALYLCAQNFTNATTTGGTNEVLNVNGKPNPAYYAMRELQALKGQRLAQTIANNSVSVIATGQKDTLTVIIANMAHHYSIAPKQLTALLADAPQQINLTLAGLPTPELWKLSAYRLDGQPTTFKKPELQPDSQGAATLTVPLQFGHYVVLEFRQQR